MPVSFIIDADYGYKHFLIKVDGPALKKVDIHVLSRTEGSGKGDAARVAFLSERYQAQIPPTS